MSEPANRAIFLSYASQDAEAARRICEALRAEGVEVWFDADGGLEHGDEWDAKIRRQIKECILFIPLISANTQARHEGYFRIEWELAAQRAMGIASGVAFVLPVVIDDTREQDALVPDRFRMVQWTRLPGGVVTPEVKARYLKLWSHRIGAVKHESSVGRGRRTPPSESSSAEAAGSGDPALQSKVGRRVPAAAWIAAIVVAIAAVVGFITLRPKPNAGAGTRPPTAERSAAPLSEARRLLAQARTLLETGDDMNRENFHLAEELLKRASTLDPADGEVLAAQAILADDYMNFGYDRTAARLEMMRTQAERAIKLAPDSDQAAFAYALYLIRVDFIAGQASAASRDGLARMKALVAKAPQNKAYHRALAFLFLGDPATKAEAYAEWDRANALPGGDALAMAQAGMNRFFVGDLAEAERAIAASLAVRPNGRALIAEVLLKLCWRGDLDGAVAAIQRWPGWLMQEERGAYVAATLWLWRKDYDKALAAIRAVNHEIFRDTLFLGPRAALEALIFEAAGRPEAARLEWERAAKVTDAMTDLGEVSALYRVMTRARLGDRPGAEAALRVLVQSWMGGKYDWAELPYWHWQLALDVREFITGPTPASLPRLETFVRGEVGPRKIPRAALQLNPAFDPWRSDPRFAALVAAAPAPADNLSAAATTPGEKSVAVLAFENKSDDKANEFFSDGIAEELLTLLQRIPGLHVMGRASAFSFKGKKATVPEIGRALGVAHLVEGSVQKIGNTVKITASLSRTATGELEWSEIYTKELRDVFAVQSELAQTIVGKVRGQLGAAEKSEIASQVQAAQKGGTKNAESLQLYLQGKFYYARQTSEEVARAIEYFEKAVALDETFATAWVAIARARSWQGSFESVDVRRFRQAQVAAERALGAEPNLAEAHAMVAQIMLRHHFDWRKAREAVTRAQSLAPESIDVLMETCMLGQTYADWDNSIAAGRRAVALDPLNPEPHLFLAISLFHSARLPEAETEIRRAIDLAPTGVFLRLIACQILLAQGRPAEALALAKQEPGRMHMLEAVALAEDALGHRREADAALKALEAEYADGCPFQIAEVYAARNDPDPAFKWLEHGWRTVKDPGTSWIRGASTLNNLHRDPRWPAFLRKLGLSDEQLK